jgi:hypothetical protein
MANQSKSSIFEPAPGVTDPVPVPLRRDYRLAVPAEVRRAVAWLAQGAKSQEVVFELSEPGRVRVIEAALALPRIREAANASPEDAEDLRLIYSTGAFIRDRLDLSDLVPPHLGILRELGQDDAAALFVRAFGGDIEIWSPEFWAAEVARAAKRQSGLMESLKPDAI